LGDRRALPLGTPRKAPGNPQESPSIDKANSKWVWEGKKERIEEEKPENQCFIVILLLN